MKNKLMIKNVIRLIFVSILSVVLLSCSATHTAINKRKLNVQTKMSSTVFLDPVASERKTVFVQVRNTTGKEELNLESKVKQAILAKGYQVVDNPDKAHYLLQTNVLQVGNIDLREAEHALNGGYGAALSGAAGGAVVGSLAGSDKGVAIGALVGTALSTVANAMVKDVTYTAITDLQISERVGSSIKVRERTTSKLKQGTSSSKNVVSTETTNWKRYQTRIISTANKVNLKFEEAVPQLVAGLSNSIAGVF